MNPHRILIIDDDPSLRLDARDALRPDGYEFFEASNTCEAEVVLLRAKPHILLLDLELPEFSALSFLESLKLEPDSPYEVIVMTESRHPNSLQHCYDHGVCHILPRPFDGLTLRSIIRNALAVRQRFTDLRQYIDTQVKELSEHNQDLLEERSTLENRLRHLEQKDDRLAGISHDFRTPIGVVAGFAEMLADTHLSTEQQTWVSHVQEAGQLLRHLADDVLELYQLESAGLELVPQATNLYQQFSDIIAQHTMLAGQKGLSVQFIYTNEAPRLVQIDSDRLARVIHNLLTNAVKFTEHGQVVLRVDGRQVGQTAHLLISVSDTGPGIAPSDLERIFQRFEQACADQESRSKGVGLGLSVSREIIELMGSQLSVESSPGRGSKFWFKLKMPILSPSESLPLMTNIGEAPTVNPRILLADDDAMTQKLVRKMLSNLGFTVDLASNGQEALETLKQGQFEAVLLDCDMPIMDGFETTRQIRAREFQTDSTPTPIIALTGLTSETDKEAILAAGATEHISKPFGLADLQAALRPHIQSVLN